MRIKTAGSFECAPRQEGGFVLTKTWAVQTTLPLRFDIYDNITKELILSHNLFGWLTMHKGYRWNGASGPVVERSTNRRSGCAHDGLYRGHRESKIPLVYRGVTDDIYVKLYLDDVDAATSGGPWYKKPWHWLRRGVGYVAGTLDRVGLLVGGYWSAKPQKEVDLQRLKAP